MRGDEKEIFAKVRAYLEGQLSLFELQDWISARELHWASRPRGNPARILAGRVMLSYYEYGEGHRDESSVRQLMRQELQRLSPQPA